MEKIKFKMGDREIELTRPEFEGLSRFSLTADEMTKYIISDEADINDIFARMFHLGMLIERADRERAEAVINGIFKATGIDTEEDNRKIASVVAAFVKPMKEEHWQRAIEKAEAWDTAHREGEAMADRLFGREEAKPFA